MWEKHDSKRADKYATTINKVTIHQDNLSDAWKWEVCPVLRFNERKDATTGGSSNVNS